MVEDGGEIGELPYLEIDPPDLIFRLIEDDSLRDNRYASFLFDRPVNVWFYEELIAENSRRDVGIEIESCRIGGPRYRIGKRTYDNRWKEYFFRGGVHGELAQLEEEFNFDLEKQQEVVLSYLEQSLRSGFLELEYRRRRKRGRHATSEYLHNLSGPIGDDSVSPGWIRRWVETQKRIESEWYSNAFSGKPDEKRSLLARFGAGCAAIVLVPLLLALLLLLIPIVLVILIFFLFGKLFSALIDKKYVVAHRYPPFPTE